MVKTKKFIDTIEHVIDMDAMALISKVEKLTKVSNTHLYVNSDMLESAKVLCDLELLRLDLSITRAVKLLIGQFGPSWINLQTVNVDMLKGLGYSLDKEKITDDKIMIKLKQGRKKIGEVLLVTTYQKGAINNKLHYPVKGKSKI